MMRFALGVALCLGLAACSSTGTGPVAQAAQVTQVAAGNSATAQLNSIRAGAGQRSVQRNRALDAAARAHASDMSQRNFFSHTGSNGSAPAQRVTAAGYRWCTVAENIAAGISGQDAAMEGWRKSPGHFRNMTNSKMREFGLANVGDVWVMVLAASRC